tara:strand:+ start:51 stop:1388 length:1338 start_codon:yes stop_codon:yes gene_type:complete
MVSVRKELYKDNRFFFRKSEKWLNDFYLEFPNRSKIILLLEHWIFSLKSIANIYGPKGLSDYIETSKRNRCFMEFSYDFEMGKHHNKIVRNKSSRYFFILSLIVKEILLPGVPINSFFDKMRWRISEFFIGSLPIVKNAKKKDELIHFLLNCLPVELKISKEHLHCILPELFFSNVIHVSTDKASLIVKGSMVSLLQFKGYENILLTNWSVLSIGFQHGGGYGLFKEKSPLMECELSLCDEFYGWGLMGKNIKQKRFNRYRNEKENDFLFKRIVWVERPATPVFYQSLIEKIYNNRVDLSPIYYIYDELKKINKNYYNLPYPGRIESNNYNNLRGVKIENNGNVYDNLKGGDVVIFDILEQTLVHYCIENNILFIFVTTRKCYDLLDDNFKIFFDIFYDNRLGFFADEKDGLCNSINNIFNNEYSIPRDVESYLRHTFLLDEGNN